MSVDHTETWSACSRVQVNEEDDYYDGPSDAEYTTDDSNGMVHTFLISFKFSLVPRAASGIKGKLV